MRIPARLPHTTLHLPLKAFYTPDLLVKQVDANTLGVRNAADNADKDLKPNALIPTTSTAIYRDVDNDFLQIFGGDASASVHQAKVAFFGQSHPGTPGRIEYRVPNAALNGTIVVEAFTGATDTPGWGLFTTAPQVQQAHIADPTDLATCIAVLTTLLADLEGYGLLKTP